MSQNALNLSEVNNQVALINLTIVAIMIRK